MARKAVASAGSVSTNSRAKRSASARCRDRRRTARDGPEGRPGWSANSNDVTTPKLPPPPRSAQNRSGFSSVDARTMRESAVTTSAATQVVAGEPGLLGEPADAAAERESRDAGVADEAAGGRQPVLPASPRRHRPRWRRRRTPRAAPPDRRRRRSSRRDGSSARRRTPSFRRSCGRRRGLRSGTRPLVPKRMASATCSAVVQHAITAGLRSMAPFQTARDAVVVRIARASMPGR